MNLKLPALPWRCRAAASVHLWIQVAAALFLMRPSLDRRSNQVAAGAETLQSHHLSAFCCREAARRYRRESNSNPNSPTSAAARFRKMRMQLSQGAQQPGKAIGAPPVLQGPWQQAWAGG